MKLQEMVNMRKVARPTGVQNNVNDGSYPGEINLAEFVERESKFSDDGMRIMLNMRIKLYLENDESVELYHAVNYTWSQKGHMIKILEKLEMLPAPGEKLDLDQLVGLPVQVIVENVIKDGVTYSNIVSIKRRQINQSPANPTRESGYTFQQAISPVRQSLQSMAPADLNDMLD